MARALVATQPSVRGCSSNPVVRSAAKPPESARDSIARRASPFLLRPILARIVHHESFAVCERSLARKGFRYAASQTARQRVSQSTRAQLKCAAAGRRIHCAVSRQFARPDTCVAQEISFKLYRFGPKNGLKLLRLIEALPTSAERQLRLPERQFHSTVTLFARFLGLSTSVPRSTAV